MDLGINIQRAFKETEKTLTKFSARPLIGSPFGVVRVVLGVGQLSIALITGILAGISVAAFKCNKNILEHSIVHITHGFKNIILGVVGTIPLIQIAVTHDYVNPKKYNKYHHEHKHKISKLEREIKELEAKMLEEPDYQYLEKTVRNGIVKTPEDHQQRSQIFDIICNENTSRDIDMQAKLDALRKKHDALIKELSSSKELKNENVENSTEVD